MTSNLPNQIVEHKTKKYKNSFSAKYNLDKLVYWESFHDIGEAIGREKQLKAGSRKKKEDLIKYINPNCVDLFESIKEIMK